MPQSFSNVLVRIVFSTKERQPFLLDTVLRAAIYKHLAAVSTQLRCPVIKVGGVEDHLHILARQARAIALAEWVKEMKRTSSLCVKEARQGCRAFQWQAGYGAFFVSQSQSAAVEPLGGRWSSSLSLHLALNDSAGSVAFSREP